MFPVLNMNECVEIFGTDRQSFCYKIVNYSLNNVVCNLALVTTYVEQRRGLAFTVVEEWRSKQIDGMMFEFPFAAPWPIWMRGMLFPITAYWLKDNEVVGKTKCSPNKEYRPIFPNGRANKIIELINE